jgi:biotin carboxylase
MRILFLGGSHSEYPLIREAEKLKIDYFSLGLKRYELVNPRKHFFEDYTDINKVIEICKKYRIGRIVSGCNDFAAIAAAQASELLGIAHERSFFQATQLQNKDLWGNVLNYLSIPIPRSTLVDLERGDLVDLSQYWATDEEFIVKPVDLTGGKGIFKSSLNKVKNDLERYKSNTRESRLLIQEFIDGSLHSAFTVFDGLDFCTFFADEDIDSSYRVRMATMPSHLSSSIQNSIKLDVRKIAHHLNLRKGILHLQFMVCGDIYKIVDFCARPPGDLFLNLIEYTYNFNFSRYWIDQSNQILPEAIEKPSGFITRVVENSAENMTHKYLPFLFVEFRINNADNYHRNTKSQGQIKFYRLEDIDATVNFREYVSGQLNSHN